MSDELKNEDVEIVDDELEQVSGGANQLPKRRQRVFCYSCRQYGYIRRHETVCPNCGATLEKSEQWRD